MHERDNMVWDKLFSKFSRLEEAEDAWISKALTHTGGAMDQHQLQHDNHILTVIDWLKKMVHFIPCVKTMTAEYLAQLMLHHVWFLHGAPKTITLDRGSIFISQITCKLSRSLGISSHPSTTYQPRKNGQSGQSNSTSYI